MATPLFTKEYITLEYGGIGASLSPEALRDILRSIEGYLQRMETRIEVLQGAVQALEKRVTALE